MSRKKPDPGWEEIRRVRHEISEEIGHDPKRLPEYYSELEAQYAHRVVHSEEAGVQETRPVAG